MPFSSRHAIDDPAEDAAQLLTRIGLVLLFVVSQIAPILAGQTIYILLPVGATLLLVSAALASDSFDVANAFSALRSPAVLGALFFAGWTGLSLAWTPFGDGPSERYIKSSLTLALVGAACFLLPARTRTSNLDILPIGTGAAALALAAAALLAARAPAAPANLDGSALERAGLGLALLVWPALGALALRGRWRMASALAGFAAGACLLAKTPNALPALLAGAVVFAVSFGRAKRVARIIAPLSAATVLLAPLPAALAHFAFVNGAPAFVAPLAAWGHILANDGPRMLIGHGFGAAVFGVLGHYLYPITPRSLVFEVWFDLGLLGAGALAAVSWRLFIIAGRTRPALAPFLLAGLSTAFAISVLGPAAEQLWWVSFAGLDAIAFALLMRGQHRTRRPRLQIGPDAAKAQGTGVTRWPPSRL